MAVNLVSQPKRTFINFRTPKIAEMEHETWKDTGSCYTLTATTSKFIFLNRPKQLNALNLDMIRHIYPRLKKYEEAKTVNSIVIAAAGDHKAFCAGGDILSLYKNGSKYLANRDDQKSYERVRDFFNEEYKLNYLTSTLNTPLITVANGITMGGGVGLSLHTHYSFATEKTLFAMPETSIGFFPDVGASHLLPRCENEVGMYLALTGDRIRGADLTQLGLAKYFTFTQNFNGFYNRLADAHETIHHVRETIEMMNVPLDNLPLLSLTPHLECIERCFSKGSVEEIIEALKAETKDVEFAKKTLATLERVSPLSLKITYEQMRRGRTMDLADCLKQEYRIALNMIGNEDFYTGVKAVIVDKTRNIRPNWKHADIKSVTDAEVAKYFEVPAGEKDLDLFNVAAFRGKGWSCIEKYPFNENVTDDPAVNANEYPMFDKIPQQRHATDEIQQTAWAYARDKFQTMYWNYVLRYKGTFEFDYDAHQEALKEVNEYVNELHDYGEDFKPEFLDEIGDLEYVNAATEDHVVQDNSSELVKQLNKGFNRMLTSMKQRTILNEKKAELEARLNKGDKTVIPYIEAVDKEISNLLPLPEAAKDPNSIFNSFNRAVEKLNEDYPLVKDFLMKADLPANPVFERANLYTKRPIGDEALDIITNPVAFAPIRKQLIGYYTGLAKLMNVPEESLDAFVRLDIGDTLASALALFDTSKIADINPVTKRPYYAIVDQWLYDLENSTLEQLDEKLSSIGLHTDSITMMNGRKDLAAVLDHIRFPELPKTGMNALLESKDIEEKVAAATAKQEADAQAYADLFKFHGDERCELDVLNEVDRLRNIPEYRPDTQSATITQEYNEALAAARAIEEYEHEVATAKKNETNPEPTFETFAEEKDILPASLQHTLNQKFEFEFHEDVPDFVDKEALKVAFDRYPSQIPDYLKKTSLLTSLDTAAVLVSKPIDINKATYNDEWIYDEFTLKPRFAPLSKDAAVAREFLWYLGLDYESINYVYPGFDYFLACPYTDPLRGAETSATYNGVQFFDHPDHFKMNFTDYARPMIPPRLLAKVKEATKTQYHEYIADRGLTDVYAK